jgi:cyclic beta-1,2-glucan synthetase
MTPSPGYIQGYVPGVRENGGQYTHAALWTVLAFAEMGDGDRAHELFTIINPLSHTGNTGDIARYRTEPYVVAADVYSQPPHVGRGGWTWYTGSAAWMYRVGIEGILGLTMVRAALHVDPCIPKDWPEFSISFRRPRCDYRITVENPERVNHGVVRVELDGEEMKDGLIPIREDGRPHVARVVLGARAAKS